MTDNVLPYPIRTGDKPEDVNMKMFFSRADAILQKAADDIDEMLATLTYQQLVLVSDRSAERIASVQFLNDVICDGFERHREKQQEPEGAA